MVCRHHEEHSGTKHVVEVLDYERRYQFVFALCYFTCLLGQLHVHLVKVFPVHYRLALQVAEFVHLVLKLLVFLYENEQFFVQGGAAYLLLCIVYFD